MQRRGRLTSAPASSNTNHLARLANSVLTDPHGALRPLHAATTGVAIPDFPAKGSALAMLDGRSRRLVEPVRYGANRG